MNEVFCHVWVLMLTHLVAGPVVVLLGYLLRGGAGRLVGLIPGLEARSIRGEWDTSFQRDDQTITERVEVSQFLRWVWGTITYSQKKRKFHFRGRLRENVFVATYEVKGNPSVLDLGTFTLLLDQDGEMLKGRYSWIDSSKPGVQGHDYEWRKAS